MTRPFTMTEAECSTVEQILRSSLPAGADIWVFGSRAQPTAEAASDLDLLIDVKRPLTLSERSKLESGFEFSSLPYRVDVVDAHRIRGIFAANVLQNRVLLFTI